jgi:hypothetical protein
MTVVRWLLAREYDVRLLSRDLGDLHSRQDFRDPAERTVIGDENRITDKPICSVEDLCHCEHQAAAACASDFSQCQGSNTLS